MALNDDFNTPETMAEIFSVVRQFNSQVKRGMKLNSAVIAKSQSFQKFVLKVGSLMSLFQLSAREFLITLDDMLLKKKNLERAKIDEIVQRRVEARAQKDFKKSDELREQLTQMGIAVSDLANGSEWEVAK